MSAEAKTTYANVPWLQIAGMRHRLVHDYGEVDAGVSYRAVTDHLPGLIKIVKQALEGQGGS